MRHERTRGFVVEGGDDVRCLDERIRERARSGGERLERVHGGVELRTAEAMERRPGEPPRREQRPRPLVQKLAIDRSGLLVQAEQRVERGEARARGNALCGVRRARRRIELAPIGGQETVRGGPARGRRDDRLRVEAEPWVERNALASVVGCDALEIRAVALVGAQIDRAVDVAEYREPAACILEMRCGVAFGLIGSRDARIARREEHVDGMVIEQVREVSLAGSARARADRGAVAHHGGGHVERAVHEHLQAR